MKPTLKQLRVFVNIRNKSAYNSNLQFSIDAETCGFSAEKDLPKAQRIDRGQGNTIGWEWKTPCGKLTEINGVLSLNN